MSNWRIGRLAHTQCDRRGFSCGDDPDDQRLNRFIRELATQYERRGLGHTFVALPDGGTQVAGYYTLSAGSVRFDATPIKLPQHPVPTIHLGRLAVDQQFHGQGLGKVLLLDALRRTLEVERHIAVHALDVFAYPKAKPFYEHFGFRPLLDDPLHLYLPITQLRKLGLTSQALPP